MSCGSIQLIMVGLALEIVLVVYSVLMAELLQFTVAAPYAGKAFLIMV